MTVPIMLPRPPKRLVPPMIVAVVMVLQRFEGLSDREAVERFAFDARWKYAAGGLDFDYPGFVHTVLVDMRARLARSDRPDRVFETVLQVAKAAGLVGRRRVLDSTPLYDAVATMDTVTLVHSAIRGLLRVVDGGLAGELRSLLSRDDDYLSAGKPVCDYEDRTAREALVDGLARDAMALVDALNGRPLDTEVDKAARLLATVVGQDLDEVDGVFRIARRVAKDRVISTVDPDARYGHKTSARGFDGYKGHLALDPDTEIITATTVTAANAGDADPAEDLLAHDLLAHDLPEPASEGAEDADEDEDGPGDRCDEVGAASRCGGVGGVVSEPEHAVADTGTERSVAAQQLAVYGDAAYGAGPLLATLENAGARIMTKVQPPPALGGRFAKDRFHIDLAAGTVTCPRHISVPIRPAKGGGGVAAFGTACAGCLLAAQCTASPGGRTVTIGAHEAQLARARAIQIDPTWRADYTATRPKVERKIGHLMRRRHGGRRARVRGTTKVAADLSLLAAAVNLARLGVLGLRRATGQRWQVLPT